MSRELDDDPGRTRRVALAAVGVVLGTVIAACGLLGLIGWSLGALHYESEETRQARLAMEAACSVDACAAGCLEARRKWYLAQSECAKDDRDCMDVALEMEKLNEVFCR